jgi:hypothetical protein
MYYDTVSTGRGNDQNPSRQGEVKIEVYPSVGDQRLGIQFLRFNDLEVKTNMPGGLSVIK